MVHFTNIVNQPEVGICKVEPGVKSLWLGGLSTFPDARSRRRLKAAVQQSERTLTPAQLKRELRRIAWGHVRLAQKLGVWPTEVRDWLAGKEPVPEVVASDIRNLPSAR